MKRPRFDPVILAPTRLMILAVLAATEWAEFKFVREAAGMSDSALSKQLDILEGAGLINIRKGFVGKRPRTWINLSAHGRRSFETHVEALKEIVEMAGSARTAS